jgi:rhodanese-related sulfurtransferase
MIFGALGLVLGMIWQYPLIQQGFQGTLHSHLEQLEKQEAARRLEGVRTLNLDQAYLLHQKGQALFIDARPPGEYQELHIEGAVNLTSDQLKNSTMPDLFKNHDANRTIIVYCGHEDCHASLQVAELLQTVGFTQVAVFMGGFRAWDQAGYPVDVSR